MFPKSLADWKTSELNEEIRDLKMNNIALQGSFNDTVKSLDQVTQSLNRSGSLVKRFTQQHREFAGHCPCFTGSRGFLRPRLNLPAVSVGTNFQTQRES